MKKENAYQLSYALAICFIAAVLYCTVGRVLFEKYQYTIGIVNSVVDVGDATNTIIGHGYINQFVNDHDLEKIRMPVIEHDTECLSY